MKGLVILQKKKDYPVILLLLFFIACTNPEEAYKEAKGINTIEAYENFMMNHPESEFDSLANIRIEMLKEKNAWEISTKKNTIESYNSYIKAYPDGQYINEVNQNIESIEWNTAFTDRNKQKISECIKKYAKSDSVKKAKQILWDIKWETEKASSVTIFSNGQGIIRGKIEYSLGGMFGYQGQAHSPKPGGPNRVFIWLDDDYSANDKKTIKKYKIRPGRAYLKTDSGVYKFIRKIDTNKSRNELCAEFGVLK